jgi:glutamyl-tRNA synthetase
MTTPLVRTRMAPSPTGEMHVGSMSILFKNYVFAKKHTGKFVLRIEDTDKAREVPGAVDRIQHVIKAYGLDWDEGPSKGGEYGPYTQSERLKIYAQMAETLVKKNKAYYCICSEERLTTLRENQRQAKIPPKYDRHCRDRQAEVIQAMAAGATAVIRLATPDNQEITFTDLIRGPITFNSSVVDDQILIKSDGYPTYHLGVVVDDHLMKITHVMRGEEWISSTPKHILLYQAFEWELPVFAHIPIYLNPDGKGKMSKRKGTVSAQSFLDQGYLPEALLNFFMILGWAHPEEKEIISLEEYIRYFDPKDVSAKSVVFDLHKLNWINGVYIRQLSPSALLEKLKPFIPTHFPMEKLEAIIPLINERLEKLSDFADATSFFYGPIVIPTELLLKKATPQLVTSQLEETITALTPIEWDTETIEATIRTLQEAQSWKKQQYFMLLRVATTGRKATPPLFETMQLIGKEGILERLQQAQTQVAA